MKRLAMMTGCIVALAWPGSAAAAGTFATSSFNRSSADGSRIIFSTSEPLLPADTDSVIDVYERSGGTTKLVSAGQINGNGAFYVTYKGASADARRIFFVTSEQLVPADTDPALDVYERSGGTTKLVSAGQINGNGAFDVNFNAASNDGSRVIFSTNEQLVPTDTDAGPDVYERAGGKTSILSVGEGIGQGGYSPVFSGASNNGLRVFFSALEQLVPADTDSDFDVYQRSGQKTDLISAGQINGNGAFSADFVGASADGSRAFFVTSEQLVPADTDTATDTYERSGGTTKLISAGEINGNGDGMAAEFKFSSPDGHLVIFETAEQLVPADTDSSKDIYERVGNTTVLVSGGEINGNGDFEPIFYGSKAPWSLASADGSRVIFVTAERLVPADTDDAYDSYEYASGATTLVSVGEINGNGPEDAFAQSASTDGSRVFFETAEQLVPADTDTATDVYERSGGKTTLVSTGPIDRDGNGFPDAHFNGANPDGRRVFFLTSVQLVPSDTDSASEVYERSGGMTKRLATGIPDPKVVFESRPPRRITTPRRRARVSFSFSSQAGSSFECRLDRGPPGPCSSPVSLILGLGKHRFRVRATNLDGNAGPTARLRLRVIRRR